MKKILIVIGREFNTRVRKKSFLIMTILVPILLIGFYAFMMWMMLKDDNQERKITVINNSILERPIEKINNNVFDYDHNNLKEDEINSFLDREGYYAAILIPQDIMTKHNIKIFSLSQVPMDLEKNITDILSKHIENIKKDSLLKSIGVNDLDKKLAATKVKVRANTLKIDESTGAAKESSSGIISIIGMAGGFIIYMFIFMYAGQVMQGVIEEKTNRIVEVLVSSIKPFQFLLGKIVGIASVGLLQFIIWILIILVGIVVGQALFMPQIDLETIRNAKDMASMANMSGVDVENLNMVKSIAQTLTPSFVTTFLISFLVYFIGGYLIYAGMFAAIGAAVDNQNDTQQFMTPITILLVAALYIGFAAIKSPESPLVFWFSMIPFTSPVVMLVRIPFGIPTWEILLSMTILVVSFVGMTFISAKIYRVGILMYGKKPSWKELYKWLKY